ncbi:MAG: enoyl-CoA hydratase [Phyllobacteriaceae bacterium]|nr:enoyl-CoA hydratase [Phyllobacteriaceae bacterium]MBA90290.1 enoyl-CoA hydratase [Phyllobacteriaceae bacterium]
MTNTNNGTGTVLKAEQEGTIRVLTLDGPQSRNSIGPENYRDLQRRIIDAAEDSSVRAIVVSGAGGFFCSGGNVTNLQRSAAGTMAEATANTDALNAMILAIRHCPKPVIAAVEGGAAGAGFSLALACDLIVAAQGARFLVSYVKVGLTPDGGVTHFLTGALPRQLVGELCLLGRPASAERLHAAGVVNTLSEPGRALGDAMALAGELTAGASGAQAVIKAEIAAAPFNDLASQLDLEARGINRARFGAEAREGLAAFLEKRKPEFHR